MKSRTFCSGHRAPERALDTPIDSGATLQYRGQARGPRWAVAGVAADSRGLCYPMLVTDASCPECGQPSVEAAMLPDGRVTYCPRCGYRGVDHGG
ncbi:MAG: hypothetical protein L0H83_08655 [Salinisphaera sp.]|nr:hypothetical protein [Salinisphaera sp.]